MTREMEKSRLSPRTTVKILSERLTNNQMLQLVGNKNFESHQPYLLKELQTAEHLPRNGFKKVHISKACKVSEVDTGDEILISGTDIDFGHWNKYVHLKRLECDVHNTSSEVFFDHSGDIREGPFHSCDVRSSRK